ncbi:helix-turn-helix domain-containing protein [Streptococcus parasanguinis]|jgi:transcription regulator|uniref:helix-turn-helix domain-containing protein n=1 Tax=Streptococcus parasanguinis TaxID=1318 RepID=UPI0012BBE2AC|nr:helix-turn-helix transcriptional regulator [Streptococcus parasanguinis]MTS07182.1 helix-turn-helix domain-containing protein [Streptococcus parasanguinis]
MIIGKLVREYRLKKKLTQQELAELSDLSLPFINLVENNRRNLSVDTLLRILQAMEIEPSDFFKPLSYSSNQDLQLLIEKLQVKEDSSEYIKVFLNILRLSEDR